MAVYTEVSDEDLNGFVASYDIGDVLSFKGIAEGVENSNYLLRTTQSSFILTLYEKRVDERDLPFFLGLMEFLSGEGIPCPLPVSDREGNRLRTLAGRPAALITFLDGMWVRRPRTEHCAELGAGLAGLHLASTRFSMERQNALLMTAWREILGNCAGKLDQFENGLQRELEADLEQIASAWPSDLPRGVIHADLFPDNVFFLGGKLSGFIDFYFACTDFFAYDIAICLNAWCFETDGSFNITKAKALLRGYQSARSLSANEIAALPTLARGASMRFLVTRLYDWINTPEGAFVRPKNPMEYIKKLRFHRQIESASEYGLEQIS
ncbi:MAG: homoserine kinase [Rhizobiales bacterium]|nr:homoserine kinase [Hyphomicrobiales bacterium]